MILDKKALMSSCMIIIAFLFTNNIFLLLLLDNTEEKIKKLIGQRTRLSDGYVKGVGWTYAVLLDNPCKHKHYLSEDCTQTIYLYGQ
jgi:hypothetical protein